MKFKECTKCGGGKVNENPVLMLNCPTCKNHKRIYQEVIELDTLGFTSKQGVKYTAKGWSNYFIDDGLLRCSESNCGISIELEHKLGDIREFVCDVCGGSGRRYNSIGDIEDYEACPICEGNEKTKAKLLSQEIKDNKLIQTWGECNE